MMLNRNSRHRFSMVFVDSAERLFLGEREPFRYRDLPDNLQHLVQGGESLFTIAGRFYLGYPRPAGLWWVLADFQPVPVHDPTIALVAGTLIVVPSMRVVQTQILNPARRNVVA